MARETKVILVDDLDGGPADETVAFSLDGVSYEIDLKAKNAAKLRDALAPWVGSARKAGRSGRRGGRGGGGRRAAAVSRKAQPAEIREWALAEGLDVSPRGRIPAHIMEQYAAAHR